MTPAEAQAEVFHQLALCASDPDRFVRWAFPWGEPNTDLERFDGPDAWQRESMDAVKAHLTGPLRFQPYQEAISSGHGIGKSADVAWMVLWAFMTAPMCRGVVTANTQTQLQTKTWAEVQTWYNRLHKPLRDMFKCEATSLHALGANAKTWRIDAIPWSATNTEAFAGLHNQGKRILVVFDEGSAIVDTIWEVTEGALTDKDTEILWLVRGNPTRSSGRFKECFAGGRHSSSWRSDKIDSRNVKITNKDQIQKWIDAYGEDSDFVRVRVRGEFPNSASNTLISDATVTAAIARKVGYTASDPVVWGLDPARFGDDEAVLAKRRGRDASSFPWKFWRKMEATALAQLIAMEYQEARKLDNQPDMIFVDEGGLGGPVIDILRSLNIPNVVGVNFGGAEQVVLLDSGVSVRAFNPAAAMYLRMNDWLSGAMIPDDPELKAQLVAREYGFSNRTTALQLESKEDMKGAGRNLPSPDRADALALTHAMTVMPRQIASVIPGYSQNGQTNVNVQSDYDIHAVLR